MTKKYKILISAPYFQPVWQEYRDFFDKNNLEVVVPKVEERLNEGALLEIISDIDGVICGDDAFTEKVLEAAKKLKVISKWGTGIDSINLETCKRLRILVKNTPNAFTQPVADSVLAYILVFARNIPFMTEAMRQGVWKKIPGVALNERTLGIIGLGNIGKAVAKRAAAFGMKIIGNDIKEVDDGFIKETGVVLAEKEELYRTADFISLNCDLNPSSRHLINKSALSKMKNTAFIINTARGGIIKEDDLLSALKHGQIAGAGLDVFENEPLPKDCPLLKMNNVLLAPHNSNSSPKAWQNVHKNTINNLLEGLKNER